MTFLAGLIGHPVGHSISPQFQQAAFDALGLDARYERWDTSAEQLAERVARLREQRFLGANVTVPHKETVLPLLDDIDPLVRRVAAVNTIVRDRGRLRGFNTDVAGFRRALAEAGGFSAADKTAVVLGAGGVARAVVLALQLDGARSVSVTNRHHERAQRLVDELRADGAPALAALAWEEAQRMQLLRSADLLVNCTTIGMAGAAAASELPLPREALAPHLFVCDVVANPRRTPLLLAAAAAGCRTLGGLAMLVYQGAASFELWTGRAAPVELMLDAAENAMDAREAER